MAGEQAVKGLLDGRAVAGAYEFRQEKRQPGAVDACGEELRGECQHELVEVRCCGQELFGQQVGAQGNYPLAVVAGVEAVQPVRDGASFERAGAGQSGYGEESAGGVLVGAGGGEVRL